MRGVVRAGARRPARRRARRGRGRRPVPEAPTWDARARGPGRRATAPRRSRMKRCAASSPESTNRAPISASTTSPMTLSLSLARSSRACLPTPDQPRKAELAADLGAGLARDQGIVAPRHLAFGLVRVAVVERAGDDQAEHPVAEEFEPLVAVAAEARMGQRALEQLEVARLPGRACRGRRRRGPRSFRASRIAVADAVRRAAR